MRRAGIVKPSLGQRHEDTDPLDHSSSGLADPVNGIEGSLRGRVPLSTSIYMQPRAAHQTSKPPSPPQRSEVKQSVRPSAEGDGPQS
jgi:hypothetical protein